MCIISCIRYVKPAPACLINLLSAPADNPTCYSICLHESPQFLSEVALSLSANPGASPAAKRQKEILRAQRSLTGGRDAALLDGSIHFPLVTPASLIRFQNCVGHFELILTPAMRKLRSPRVRSAIVRECMAEFLGTFVLVFLGLSAAAQVKTSRSTKGVYLSVNMAFSVGVMSAMYLTRGISGAHLNPSVTLSFCVLGKSPWRKLAPYSLSQLLGAYVGAGLVFMVYYDAIMDFSGGVLTVYGQNETASIFATYPSEYLSLGRSVLDQVVGTGMLMLCILGLDEKRNTPAPDALIPVVVAMVILGLSASMTGNAGGAINPARDLGPRLFTLSAGWGTEVFTCYDYWFWVPLVAPNVGAVLFSFVYLVFIEWQLPDPEPPESMTDVSSVCGSVKKEIAL